MFRVGAQQDMHIPGKKRPTCLKPERKFLAQGRRGMGCLGRRRGALTGTHTESCWPSQLALSPPLSSLGIWPFPSRVQGFPNPREPAQDWEKDRSPGGRDNH